MNLARPPLAAVSQAFRFWLALRRLLPRPKCRAFGVHRAEKGRGVEKIYVINLDREPGRWSRMEQELRHMLDSSGSGLLGRTERHAAVDANAFLQEPLKDADIDPEYTLGDQLFVEPQPLVLPTQFELNAPIRMSRAEIAVARSHINVWRQVAASDHAYGLILEDDVWFLTTPDGEYGLNYLCASYKKFFHHVADSMEFMVNELNSQRPPANVMKWMAGTMETAFCIEALEEALSRNENRRSSTPTRAACQWWSKALPLRRSKQASRQIGN